MAITDRTAQMFPRLTSAQIDLANDGLFAVTFARAG